MTCPFAHLDGKHGSKFEDLERRMREFPNQNHFNRSDSATLGELAKKSSHALRKIWGRPVNYYSKHKNRVAGASTLSHTSLFLVPEFIESAHVIDPNRYSEDSIHFNFG